MGFLFSPSHPPICYSIHEFATLVRRSPRTLRRWAQQGVLVPDRDIKGKPYYTDRHYYQFKGKCNGPERDRSR